jgi:pimeloyl-ACP methyl ester carboxylesterase
VLGNCAGAFLPTGNAERLDVMTAVAEVSRVDSLGSLPMSVITAVTRTLPAGLSTAEVTRLTDAWDDGQQEWTALSTTARLVSVDDTGHHIEIDQPEIVIDAITDLLP